METEDRFKTLLDKSLAAYTARELRWWKQDRRGRWLVLEPGPGRLLRNSPRHVRDYIDSITEQRGRRFSSLSRARKFAHQVGGVVRRWQRRLPGGRSWRLVTNPWESAIQAMSMRVWP